jgi:hypothetical protein
MDSKELKRRYEQGDRNFQKADPRKLYRLKPKQSIRKQVRQLLYSILASNLGQNILPGVLITSLS